MAELFTPSQRSVVERQLVLLQEFPAWDGRLPVLVLDRCWLRLSCLPVEELARHLPPDGSREAPELERYRQLLRDGHPPWQAEQLCWQEFGARACREALRRYWRCLDGGNRGWTLRRYLELLSAYRRRFERERPRPLPLLVLARAAEDPRRARHRLLWLRPGGAGAATAMRHTCA
jgi:hypothetical protein